MQYDDRVARARFCDIAFLLLLSELIGSLKLSSICVFVQLIFGAYESDEQKP